jgi:hypothetical protein
MADFGFLRTIPEDRSQVASSVAASNNSGVDGRNGGGNGDAVSDAASLRAVEAGREGGSGSVVSDAMATLAGGSSGRGDGKHKSSAERGGGTGGGTGGQVRRSGGAGSGYEDAESNIGVLPGTSDIAPGRSRRRPSSRREYYSKHDAPCLERAFCYWSRSKRKKTCIWMLVLLTVTAFVLCVVLLTTTAGRNVAAVPSPPSPVDPDGVDGSNNNNETVQELFSTTPTASPTPMATIAPETIQALDAILLTLTPADLLYPPSGFEGLGPDQEEAYIPTPQAQARDWMLYEDLRRDEVLADGPIRVLQRYSLVVFFIALGRGDVLDGTQQECNWYGIHCEAPDPDIINPLDGDNGSGTVGGGDIPGSTTGSEPSGAGDGDVIAGGDEISPSLGGPLQLVVRGIMLPMSDLIGTLPSELRALTHLGELNIPDNEIIGEIPSEWFVLVPPPSTGLEEVTTPAVNSTQAPIATTIQEYEPGLYSLFWLDASRNQLSGSIPPGLWSLPFLRFVYLAENDLAGPLETLTSTTTGFLDDFGGGGSNSSSNLVLSALLEDVRLHDNRLSGTIPSWLLSRPTLRAIVANNNQFNGSLPQDDSVLQEALSLSVLDLSNNSLTGPLPNNLFTSVAAQSTLQFLYLENNQFTGALPPGDSTGDVVDGAVVLKDVWLFNNSLQGSIPPGFAQGWRNLTELLLHGNPLLTGVLGLPETLVTSATPTLAPVAVNSTTTTPATTTTPIPPTCESTWPMLERMTSDCKVTDETEFGDGTLPPLAVVCPCCTECF